MTEKQCFVFRINYDEHFDFVRGELEKGRLRQGWSPTGTSLHADGKERVKKEWMEACEKVWKDEWGPSPDSRRHAILRRMLDIKEGDLIFIPKAPEHGYFTIAEASGGYQFEMPPDKEDFGHIIPVKNQQVVATWYDKDSQTIQELFGSAWSAVTQVQEHNAERALSAAKELLKKEEYG